MARIEGILSAISLVPITLAHGQRKYEYTGTAGQPWRAMISENFPLIWKNDTVSSSQSGARMAMNQVKIDTAKSQGVDRPQHPIRQPSRAPGLRLGFSRCSGLSF